MLAVFDLGLGGWIYYIYYKTDRMAGQNVFCKLWAQTIMLQVFMEPFWMIFKLYFEAVLENQLLNYVANIVEKPKDEDVGSDPFGHGQGHHGVNDSDEDEGEGHEGG